MVKWFRLTSSSQKWTEESKVLLSEEESKPNKDGTTPTKVIIFSLIGISCAINILQAILLLHPTWNDKNKAQSPPEFLSVYKTINRNKTWEVGSSSESDALWSTGVPGTTGWVEIEHARKYGLPPGMPGLDHSEVYITTWGHQHHCLKILRKQFGKLISSQSTLVGADIYGNGLPEEDSNMLKHIMHCFDYLRQTTSCVSDLTLEGLSEESTETMLDIDGYGVEHQCKNEEAVGRWLIAHSPRGPLFEDIEL